MNYPSSENIFIYFLSFLLYNFQNESNWKPEVSFFSLLLNKLNAFRLTFFNQAHFPLLVSFLSEFNGNNYIIGTKFYSLPLFVFFRHCFVLFCLLQREVVTSENKMKSIANKSRTQQFIVDHKLFNISHLISLLAGKVRRKFYYDFNAKFI